MIKILLILLLIVTVFVSGCVGQTPSGKVAKVGEVTTNILTTTSVTMTTTTEPKSITTTVVTTTTSETTTTQLSAKTYKIGDVLSNDKIEFTVHSTRKEFSISEYSKPKSGFVYLIVDFSIKNLYYEDGYSFNPNDVEIEDEKHYTYDYSSVSYNLDKYFGTTTIAIGRTKRGEMAFEVPKDEDKFTFILKTNIWGVGLAYVDLGNIVTPSETRSANLNIDSVSSTWIDYGMVIEGKTGTGAIYSISLTVENTGNLPLTPIYDVKITHGGITTSSKSDQSGLLFSGIAPGEKQSDTISLGMIKIDEPDAYDIEVKVKEKGETTILGTATKEINVG
jgi:hypothetical protein